jgi:Ca2+-binding RTX toxin-like protein
LQGSGGTLDFSDSFTDPQKLNIEAEMATSAVRVTGSQGSDMFIGSDFADRFSGGLGNDTAYGGAGNDVIGGGQGKDHLYGDDGRDFFLFDAAPVPANIDHIGDFRPSDDTIRIDQDVFSWAGQSLGTISESAFKVIGTGQSVDANDRIIYNQDTGVLYFDVDGNKAGGVDAVAFAIVDNFSGDIPVLTYQDISIV